MHARAALPPLSLRDPAGVAHPLTALWTEGPALACIGHSDCRTTRLALPFVDRIHRRQGSAGRVVAILQDDPETARTLARELGLGLPLLLEEDPFPVAAALGLTTVPTFLLVEAPGRVVSWREGFRRSDLEVFAEALGVAVPLFAAADDAPAMQPG